MKKNTTNSIGIFDSGLGGLTVAKSVNKLLPNENIIYFGDTARVPYGSKSPETVIKFSLEIVNFLISHNVKMIVIACNTSSSYAINKIIEQINIPVTGVIEPGVLEALSKTKNNKIGVIGTNATINSNIYSNKIRFQNKKIKVYSIACPLFVPLVEEGWLNKKITDSIIQEYLRTLKSASIDTIILGCTHYPLLEKKITKYFEKKVNIIDSGKVTAKYVKNILAKNGLLNRSKKKGELSFFVSDMPYRFSEQGSNFFGSEISAVRVDL
jgi:glutamate racemase